MRIYSVFNSNRLKNLSCKSSHSKIRLWSNKMIENSLQLRFVEKLYVV
uniref:Uncharacterized protein n=1 Tax=Lepeophtheirus salmonis TaxID=72036 RepID=A0A0K2SX42_LEPSM